MSFESVTVQTDRPASEVHAALQRALAELSRAHRGAVLCFAEVVARRLYRELGYPSIHHYAAAALGFSPSRTAQFLRLAEALNRLPLLREEIAAQRIGWTKAVVVAAIATPRTESLWLAEARRLSRPDLARRAAAARALAREQHCARQLADSDRPVLLPPCPPGSPSPPLPLAEAAGSPSAEAAGSPSAEAAGAPPAEAARAPSPTSAAAPALLPDDSLLRAAAADLPIHVTLRFSPLQYARFAAQVERLRKLGARGGHAAAALPHDLDREQLVLAALDELVAAAATPTPPTTAAAPNARGAPGASPYLIVIHECGTCARATVRTPEGQRPLAPATLAAARCDGRTVQPSGVIEGAVPAAARRRVMARDGWQCQTPGCGRTRFLEVHHRVPRARGGGNDLDNLVTLCSACHRLRHEQTRRGAAVSARA